jgi:hypothetical protein
MLPSFYTQPQALRIKRRAGKQKEARENQLLASLFRFTQASRGPMQNAANQPSSPDEVFALRHVRDQLDHDI